MISDTAGVSIKFHVTKFFFPFLIFRFIRLSSEPMSIGGAVGVHIIANFR